jgi:transcriptional regulator with XRE-family HTH domain
LGINQSTYGKIEKDASNITVDRLYKIAEILESDITTLLDIGKKNIFNNQTNQGNGYVETINNDIKDMMVELKEVYEKLLASKEDQITLLKNLLEKKPNSLLFNVYCANKLRHSPWRRVGCNGGKTLPFSVVI